MAVKENLPINTIKEIKNRLKKADAANVKAGWLLCNVLTSMQAHPIHYFEQFRVIGDEIDCSMEQDILNLNYTDFYKESVYTGDFSKNIMMFIRSSCEITNTGCAVFLIRKLLNKLNEHSFVVTSEDIVREMAGEEGVLEMTEGIAIDRNFNSLKR